MFDEETYYKSLSSWLPELSNLSKINEQIGEALTSLSEKRVTLEEKMIRMYLHQLAAQSGDVIREAHLLLTSQSEAMTDSMLDELRSLTSEVLAVVAELLKMIRYDLNFLEQYYEYDFYSRLQNDCHFVERMAQIASRLQAARSAR